jgi:beta-lactamase superfamily II metal-dependent hydrolase
VLTRFRVGEVWENGRWGPGSEDTLRAAERSGACRRTLVAGQRMWLGSALVTVLNPDGTLSLDEPPPKGENEESLVLRLDWRGFSLLLTGDLGRPGEERVLASHAPVRALALKVGHHGSRFSSTDEFLAATRAAVAVISVGARNPFHHPTPEALGRLEAAGARIYRTDRDGAVVLETDGVTLWICDGLRAPSGSSTLIRSRERLSGTYAPDQPSRGTAGPAPFAGGGLAL